MSDNNNFLTGLFIGGLIGMALGILFAPKSGKETREDIAVKADELLAVAKEGHGESLEKTKTAAEDSIKDVDESAGASGQKATDTENKANGSVDRVSKSVQGKKNRLMEAVDAGLDAYRKESSQPV